MYKQIDYNVAKQYADSISEFSEFFTIQEGKKVLYLFEETFNGMTITYPQNENITNCKDNSLVIVNDDDFQQNCERMVAAFKLDITRNNRLPLDKIYKNIYQCWIDVFHRLSLQNDFHNLVEHNQIYELDKLLEKSGIVLPENFTDIIGLCNYVSVTILTELFQDTEEYVELDSNWNVM